MLLSLVGQRPLRHVGPLRLRKGQDGIVRKGETVAGHVANGGYMGIVRGCCWHRAGCRDREGMLGPWGLLGTMGAVRTVGAVGDGRNPKDKTNEEDKDADRAEEQAHFHTHLTIPYTPAPLHPSCAHF